MRTSRAKVRGLGSAKSGTGHFISQRISAIGLVFLTPFFMVPFVIALGQPWGEVVSIYKSPMNAIVAALFLLAVFHHLKLGLQTVIEDYVHAPAWRTGSLLAVNLIGTGLGFAAAFSVAMIAFSV
jgi:succinate dehydrogenase / fumarate reductase membrane anchor subunit